MSCARQTASLPSKYRLFCEEDLGEVEDRWGGYRHDVAVDKVTGYRVRFWYLWTGSLKMVHRQLRFYSMIRHPLVAPVLGYSMKDPKCWELVTRDFPNGTLAEMLAKDENGEAPPKWDDTARSKVIWGVASAMAYVCSKEGRVGLTTSHIMLDENFEPIVMPKIWGPEEKHYYAMTELGNLPWDGVWLAPEDVPCHRGRGDFDWFQDDLRTCVYQFAWVLFLIFHARTHGKTPLLKKNLEKSLYEIQKGRMRPDRIDGMSDGYWEIIEACYRHWPQARWSFAEIVDCMRDRRDQVMFPDTDTKALAEYERRVLACPPILPKPGLSMEDSLNFEADPAYATELDKLDKLSHLFSQITPTERQELLPKLHVQLDKWNPTALEGLVMMAYAIAVAGVARDVAHEIWARTLRCDSHVIQYLSCFLGMDKPSVLEKERILSLITILSRNGNPFCKQVVELRARGKDIIGTQSMANLLSSGSILPRSGYIRHFDETIRDFESIMTLAKPVAFPGYDECEYEYGKVEIAIDVETKQVYELFSIYDGDKFRDTLEVLVRVQHPCVIAICGSFLPTRTTSGRILLEYATGGYLTEQCWAIQYPTGYDEIFYVSLSVCRLTLAMRFLHSLGIKHDHLNPRNIVFVTREGVPCLVVHGLGAARGFRMWYSSWNGDEFLYGDGGKQIDDVHAWSRAVMLMIRALDGSIHHHESSEEELKKRNVRQAFSSLLMRGLHGQERPSFAEIFDALVKMDFNIFETLPDHYIVKLKRHVSEILRIESEIA